MEGSLITLVVFAIALPLFLVERIRYDLIALLILLALSFTRVLEPAEAFAGFSNPALLSILALYVFARAFSKTGFSAFCGANALRIAGPGEGSLLVFLLLGTGMLSAFVFGSAATAALLPLAMGAAKSRNLPPSRVLMPLAFGALLGGSITLVGSTTNLGLQAALLSPIFRESYAQVPPLGLFEIAPLGIAVFLTGVLYFSTAGRKWIPSRRAEKDLAEQYQMRHFLSELRVEPASSLVNQSIAQSGIGARDNVTILGISRGGETVKNLGPSTRIEAGDWLLVQGGSADILRIRTERGLTLREEAASSGALLLGPEAQIREGIVLPGSRLAGQTLLDLGFRAKTGLNVLALWRHGEVYPVGLKEMPLRVGDALLLQGDDEDFDRLKGSGDFLLTGEVPAPPRAGVKAWISASVFALALALPVVLPARGVADLSLALVSGAALLVLLRVVHLKEVYESIDWALVLLIVGMLAMSSAFVKTGLDQTIASYILSWSSPEIATRFSLAILFAAAAMLAQLARNQAAGILLAPVAVAVAAKLEGNPHAFLAVILIGASCPFLTPAGHQANAMVVGPGGYKFSDFPKVGLPLLVLVGIVAVLLAPLIWT